jgi:hypothetical protein
MTDANLIALGMLFITALGWLVNFLVQMSVLQQQHKTQVALAALQQQAELDKEKRAYDVKYKLNALDRVADWLDQGMKQVLGLIQIVSALKNLEEPDEAFLEALTKHMPGYNGWLAQVAPLAASIKRHDPLAPSTLSIPVAAGAAVSDLPHSLFRFAGEAADLTTAIKDFSQSAVQACLDQTLASYDEAYQHLERVRMHILANSLTVPHKPGSLPNP